MGWEQRGGRSYYYRKVREGGGVRSEYVGAGMLAQICADNDKDEQRNRKAKPAVHRASCRAEAELDRQLAVAETALTAMTHAALSAAGYHKHKGQWRKKRREEESTLKESHRCSRRAGPAP